MSVYNVDLIEHKTNQELTKKNAPLSSEQSKQSKKYADWLLNNLYLITYMLISTTFYIAMDQNIQDMYEKGQSLETMFIRSRLEISQKAPEQVLQEV